MNLWVLDTETTGLRGKPVEIGGIRIDDTGRSLDEIESRLNPGIPVEPEAHAIHGISDADVVGCPSLSEFIGDQSDELYWIGHNVAFDVRVCDPEIVPTRTLCTLALARQFCKEAPNHKLDTLRTFYNLSPQKAHSALGDCRNTRELLTDIILPRAGVSLLTLFERQAQPRMLAKMPFGKFKGHTMTQVPKQYRDWMLAQSDISPDMRYTLTQLQDL